MKTARALLAQAVLLALAACGGGGSGTTTDSSTGSTGDSGSGSGTTTASDAVLSLSLAGGASPGIDHLWVTVTGIAMHTDATKVYGDGDAGWVVVPLSAPVTVDLASASLSQGQFVSLVKQSISTVGTYAQLRLLVASSDVDATLTSSASAAGLTYNDEVQYTDSSGAHVVPLEIPDTQSGIHLQTSFTLSADTTTPLSIEWNAHSSLVRRASASGSDRFTLRDELQLYNQQLLTSLGSSDPTIGGSIFDAISGQIDITQFCTGSDESACIHDVVASALVLSADGSFHAEVRSVNVASDGSFVLYPLPTEASYDVAIHGGNMETILVRGVTLDAGGSLSLTPTLLSDSDTPLEPVLDTATRSVTLASATSPAAARVFFGQTIPGSGGSSPDVPFVIEYAAADPATGQLVDAVTLPAGPVHDAVFDSTTDGYGTLPIFTSVTPAEGLGGFSVWTQGTLADATSATTPLAAGATSVTPPAAPQLAAFGSGTIAVTLSGTPTNSADHAELVVSNDGGTVSVTDVSADIAHGGTVTVAVPSGSSSAVPTAAIYGVALRTWQASTELSSARWSRGSAPIDLSTTASASVTLTLP